MPNQTPNLNYCNDKYPVLSFVYALYCERDFRVPERTHWRQSAGPHGSYDVAELKAAYSGYLDYFTRNVDVAFPDEAKELITIRVPLNSADFLDEHDAYNPDAVQARTAARFMLDEMQGFAPPAPPGTANTAGRPARLAATINAQRPVISCLAVIFLNQDADFKADPAKFLAGQELTPAERKALVAFGKGQRDVLFESEADALRPGIELELQRFPACW
jgi:hypothetical protein